MAALSHPAPHVSSHRLWSARPLGIALVALSAACAPVPETAAAPLPDGSILEVTRRAAHPVFAEYRREARLLANGRVIARDSLLMDSGGAGRLEVRELASGRYLLRAVHEARILGRTPPMLRAPEEVPLDTGRLLGVFDDAPDGQWHFRTAGT